MLIATTMAALALIGASPADIVVEKVYGTELPGKYKHPACIEELANGDLYIAYYGGAGEYEPDTAVYAGRLRRGTKTWSKPKIIADTPLHSDGNPVVWQAPDGIVWLFYNVRYGETWSDTRIHCKISKDGAKTWSDAFVVGEERGMMVRSRPILLNDGDYLIPIYHETGHDRENVGADTTSLFLRYNPKTNAWSESTRIHARLGALQPSVVQMSDHHLIAYMRRGGGYDMTSDAWMPRAESHDGGKTWTDAVETAFPNPNAAIDFIKLRNGHLMLVYNDSMTERTPLTVAVSTDGDKTYPFKRNIATGPFDYAYPYAIQTRDGKIHVVYTSHERTRINHAVFEESAITGR
ncbi:MAG TPA: exo-alpha-sialidase [Candidatus Hydrogenedentes bacterium]|nr:exo-alpha-sialidase [Candidatus Hydrogenedentota bacterium]HOV72440.1 exo-alpha-sialidase [Candidatus Hydrogenedentota bacterium]